MPRKVSAEALERLRKYQFTVGDPRINRGGRPAGRSITAALRIQLAKPFPGDKKKSYLEQIALALCDAAAKGNVEAARVVFDRTEGSVPNHLELALERKSANTVLTLDSFRNLSDEELDAQMRECDEVLRRTKKVQ